MANEMNHEYKDGARIGGGVDVLPFPRPRIALLTV